jgi:putative hydrolase of the HAD superfamily
MALNKMGVASDQAWMVGDNLDWDIAVPLKLGIYAVWNDFEKKGLSAGSKIIPDRIINNISELIKDESKEVAG